MGYDPALGRFIQPDSLIPDPASAKGVDRYAYVNNNPINFNDPSGHRITCESDENCRQSQSISRMNETNAWKYLVKDDFGITMSDSGNKRWNAQNAMIIYNSLQKIDAALNGGLKEHVSGGVVKWGEYVPDPKYPEKSYSGYTNMTTITFYTIGTKPIVTMNIYHEFGHLLDNAPGMINAFSNALANEKSPAFIGADGYIVPKALLNFPYIRDDPYYPFVEPFQHRSTDHGEQWADIFANYIEGNINTSIIEGSQMNVFTMNLLDRYFGRSE